MSNGMHHRVECAEDPPIQVSSGFQLIDTAGCLLSGLKTLRALLLSRLDTEIGYTLSIDDSLPPQISDDLAREVLNALEQIDVYSLIVVTDEVTQSGYTGCDLNRLMDWVLRLRSGDDSKARTVQLVQDYSPLSITERRRRFSSSLEQAMPKARRAPLIIYRLFPRAVRIVTATAFGDTSRAWKIRAEQISFLPVITDCERCHGLVLENGTVCEHCGNPIWKVNWLNAVG